MHSTHRPPLAAILVVPLIAALILTLFAWPSAKVGPRDLPVGVVGAQPFAAPGFEVHRYASEAEAREAIEEREIYGALTGSKVLVASAASAPVAQMLTHAADGRPVEDVVPAAPASIALGASVLPLVLGGILTGVVAALLGGGSGAVPGSSHRQRADRARRDADRAELARRRRRRLLRQQRRAQPDRARDRRHRHGPARAARQGRHRARRADDGLPRQPVLRRRHLARHAAVRRGGSASCCRRARAGTCCARPGSSTARAAGGHVAVLAVWALLGLALLAVSALRRPAPAVAAVTA